MEATYPNLQTFEKKLYGYKLIEDLHYKLLNIMQLIIHNGWFYCFCNKYQGCEFDYNRVRRLCALCRMPVRSLTSMRLKCLVLSRFHCFWDVTFTTNGRCKHLVDISTIHPETVILLKNSKLP